ncbi:DMT family transporter [Fulvivirgaceae bacterium BMA12]|uniref:DMT family transporter n=1 Tax=Agaribacillus aureus TaxID=3051825 RepID=A0ABT8L1W7_9BACT|nr:DMT family transporter [Fulvivirgaceae bacterium BMA12]
MKKQPWLIYAIITTLFWGVWGAFIEIPEKSGFPATLGYVVWAMTMIPCALFALNIIKWKLDVDLRSVLLGSTTGLLGAGGQIILFHALVKVPAYLVFPIISLYPVVTVILSVMFLKERTNKRHWYGIVAALFAILMLSYQGQENGGGTSFLWLLLPVIIFLLWGIQAFVMKFSNETMRAESIFFYMMVTGVLLIPVALMMTDFNQEINWGFKGPYLAAMIQVLNALGALTLVYALRFGKAIIVVPLTALAPVITVVLSLIIYAVIPHPVVIAGMVLTMVAIYLLAE